MSIPVSTVPAVRQYLLTQIQAQIGIYTAPIVEVYLSDADHESAADLVIIGGAHRALEPFAMVGSGGPHWLRETYHLEVSIECAQFGVDSTFSTVDSRAYQLLGMVETVVRTDPSLGGLVLVARPAESTSEHAWGDEHQGPQCLIKAQIYVSAEL